MPIKKQLVWLRSDLRLEDNSALYQARQAGPVICVFIACVQQWQNHHDSPNKLWFIQENLAQLATRLASLHIPLQILETDTFDQVPALLLDVMSHYGCQGLWFNEEYGINEQTRDDQVTHAVSAAGRPCFRFTDQLLCRPGTLVSAKGDYYRVFTPFKKALYRHLTSQAIIPLPAPAAQASGLFPDDFPRAPVRNGYAPLSPDVPALWPAGEEAAATRLGLFLQDQVAHYQSRRDYPALAATSGLSPFLAVGAISIRQCFHGALMANGGELDSGCPGICTWLSELAWREFYRHILVAFPGLSRGQAFLRHTERLPWRQDAQLLAAWQTGQTGYPLVDAAMRQLRATGWMHNRLRMVSAMFLSKNLMLDWRLGEQFFMRWLIDGDLAANNGGWQWSASTGTDAAPYFRMFNPISQSRKFDPDGVFIRTWLPELAGLDGHRIHEPYGDNPQRDDLAYPRPVVDHGESRKRVMAAFRSLA